MGRFLFSHTTMDHAEPVPASDMSLPSHQSYYLPIHGIFKPSSTTTKLRVVFDASAKSSPGISLNDVVLPGPNLCAHLTSVLNRFRMYKYALSGDISKMFREIALDGADKDLHRFVFRYPQTQLIKDFQMTRLMFGVASSPYLATQVLHQLAADYHHSHPQAAAAIHDAFYVDDCLVGATTLDQAASIRDQLCDLLKQGCMCAKLGSIYTFRDYIILHILTDTY